MHTSPLAQPGAADAGGMNVYVRQLAAALARSGARCEVFTRRENPGQPRCVPVEPGLRVHHVSAGPSEHVDKELLPGLVEKWTAGVAERLSELSGAGEGVDLLHGNYWLSTVAGHALKHALDLPLVSTFHTLERVKAEAGEDEPELSESRAAGELAAIGCSDAVLASSRVEAEQLIRLYRARPERVEVVPPGVERAFFSPGDQAQARRARKPACGRPGGAFRRSNPAFERARDGCVDLGRTCTPTRPGRARSPCRYRRAERPQRRPRAGAGDGAHLGPRAPPACRHGAAPAARAPVHLLPSC